MRERGIARDTKHEAWVITIVDDVWVREERSALLDVNEHQPSRRLSSARDSELCLEVAFGGASVL